MLGSSKGPSCMHACILEHACDCEAVGVCECCCHLRSATECPRQPPVGHFNGSSHGSELMLRGTDTCRFSPLMAQRSSSLIMALCTKRVVFAHEESSVLYV